MDLPKLNFPQVFDFKITKSKANEYLIFDPIRKKNVLLTPEEWVRQHFLLYLRFLGVRDTQIIVEKQFALLQTKKRLDTLVLRKNEPFLLLEFKATDLPLQSSHLEQIMRYNSHFNAPYIMVSNGLQHALFQKNKEEYQAIKPENEDLFGRIFSKQSL